MSSSKNPIIKEILRQGRGKPRSHVLAALETGRIESNFTNPSGGDSDSAGWRQERRRYYNNPTNVRAAVKRFYQEAASHDHGQASYKLAADVQRPREDLRGRYKTAHGVAEQLLKGKAILGRGKTVYDLPTPEADSTLQTTPAHQVFDKAAYEKALRRATLARMLSHRKEGSVLLRTGILSAAEPNRSDFVSTAAGGRRVGLATPEPGTGLPGRRTRARGHAGVPSGRSPTGGRGKIIGVPYEGTHNLGNWQSDNAVDIAVPEGTKVRSTGSGKVVKVYGSYSGGKSRFDGVQVTIETPKGGRFYTHLSRASVKVGQRVKRGQVIGRSGSANGVPHLHFGVEKGDPRRFT